MPRNHGVKQIKQTYSMRAPLARVWKAFVDPDRIEHWGAGPAIMDDKVGTKFSLWGGDIHGTNTKVVKQKLLEQDWYGDESWAKPSKLTFTFDQRGAETVVELSQDDVPAGEAADIASGWEDYYMGPLKEFVEE